MVYTITMNPSLDYRMELDEFHVGETNRSGREQISPGGKGINVSIVLRNLGIDTIALGFLAGFTGRELKSRLDALKVPSDFIFLKDGETRINVKLSAESETEINAGGPEPSKDAIEMLIAQAASLTESDFLVLSGKVPAGVPNDFYASILSRIVKADIRHRVIVDAEGELLKEALPLHPLLIKPNKLEVESLLGQPMNAKEDLFEAAAQLRRMGAENVLISLGAEGACMLGTDERFYMAKAPKGMLINSVGAGDSMVAGFLSGYMENGNLQHSFRMAVAAGSASAFSDELATSQEVRELYERLDVLVEMVRI